MVIDDPHTTKCTKCGEKIRNSDDVTYIDCCFKPFHRKCVETLVKKEMLKSGGDPFPCPYACGSRIGRDFVGQLSLGLMEEIENELTLKMLRDSGLVICTCGN